MEHKNSNNTKTIIYIIAAIVIIINTVGIYYTTSLSKESLNKNAEKILSLNNIEASTNKIISLSEQDSTTQVTAYTEDIKATSKEIRNILEAENSQLQKSKQTTSFLTAWGAILLVLTLSTLLVFFKMKKKTIENEENDTEVLDTETETNKPNKNANKKRNNKRKANRNKTVKSNSDYEQKLERLSNKVNDVTKIDSIRSFIREIDKAPSLSTAEKNKLYYEAYTAEAETNTHLLKHNSAIDLYGKAIDLDQNQQLPYYKRGKLFFTLKKYKEAIDDYTTSLSIGKKTAKIYFRRACAYIELGDTKNAIRDLNECLILRPDYSVARVKKEEILKLSENVISNSPLIKSTESAPKRIIQRYNENEHTEALSPYNNITEADSEVPQTTDQYQQVSLNKANMLFEQGNYEKAIEEYLQIKENNPCIEEVFARCGKSYLEQNSPVQAISMLNRAISINKKEASYYLSRGIAKSMIPDNSAAIDDFTKVIEIVPQEPEAYLNRANIYYTQKKYDLACEDYSRTIDIDKDHTKAIFNRGLCYKMLKKYDLSENDFTQIISSSRNNPNLVEKAKNQIEAIDKLVKQESQVKKITS